MPSLVQGRVIFPKIAVLDPQGQNPKEGRPFVVITTSEDIKKNGSIFAVGITGMFDPSASAQHVPLPYGPTARTGLKKESAALCTWLIDVLPDKVDIGTGFIDPRLVALIAEKVAALGTVAQMIREE